MEIQPMKNMNVKIMINGIKKDFQNKPVIHTQKEEVIMVSIDVMN